LLDIEKTKTKQNKTKQNKTKQNNNKQKEQHTLILHYHAASYE